jgi:hypothetical protein
VKSVSTTELRVKLPRLRRDVSLKKEKIAVTFYGEAVGLLVPITDTEPITEIKTTEEMSLSEFRNNLTINWEKMQFDCDCIWITSHGRKIMAFVSPRFFSVEVSFRASKD